MRKLRFMVLETRIAQATKLFDCHEVEHEYYPN